VTPQAESVLELFRLTSGLHSAEYLQCALVLQHPAAAEKLGRLLADELRRIVNEKNPPPPAPGSRPPAPSIGMVVSPALGGLIIGHEVARALGTRHIFTERDPATRKMQLRRGFTVGPNESALVIEDVITTGGSTQDVIGVLQAAGAHVLAAGSIIDRSGGHAQLSVPRVALATLQVAAHSPEECPLCRLGIPVVKPGSRPT
jgi:orotate phosphoribosyltransferase